MLTSPDSKQDIYDLSKHSLTEACADAGFSTYHADLLWRELYVNHKTELANLDLRADVHAWVTAKFSLSPLPLVTAQKSSDGITRKYLLQLDDGEYIETVIMKYRDRYTACISTQVGCAMGCVFCATGQMGFKRHLRTGEIVTQLLHVSRELAKTADSLRNIVVMGMGEPLHNYDATLNALDIAMEQKGLNIAPKHITLSTVGLPKAIRRLADEKRPFNLAVSLHAANNADRTALVPTARHIDQLIDACRYYADKRQRRIFFEYTLIDGKNDSVAHAEEIGRLLKGLDSHLNVIPLNPTNFFDGSPSHINNITSFKAKLSEFGIPSTVRQRRGIDIDAGCGQLRERQTLGN